MTDHTTEIDRGVQADRILRDPLYLESWDMVRRAILEKIEASPVRDVEGREHLFKMLKALRDARAGLEQAVANGKVALHLREEQSRLSQLFKRKKA